MKVAFVGNMNNNFFAVVRHLRRRGVDAHLLLLDQELAHFHPSCDAFDLDYQHYTRTLNWGSPFGFLEADPRRIERDLSEFDVVVACGSAPAFLQRAGRRLDVFTPFGTDLYYYPFFKFVNPRYQWPYSKFTAAQRASIRSARVLHWDWSNDDVEAIIQRIGFTGERWRLCSPFIYTPLFNKASIPDYYDRSHWHHEFATIRRRHDLVIFHHSRHCWKSSPDRFSWKANDKLFRGVAAFVRQCRAANPCIVTCEYGNDVEVTRALCAELGITDRVYWFPQMARKDIMVGLSLADIGTGEFHRSWLSYGTIYEAMAMALPIMQYREDDLYRDAYPELYPMINVRTPDDVLAALLDYVKRPDYYRSMGKASLSWLERYAIEAPLQRYLSLCPPTPVPADLAAASANV